MTRWQLFRSNVWLIVRRAHKDKRALLVLLSALPAVCWVAYMIMAIRQTGWWLVPVDAALLLLGYGVAILIARANARTDASLLKLSAHPSPAGTSVSPEHRAGLAAELLRTAALVDRAAAELVKTARQVPEAAQGLARRRTLDVAQRPEIWPAFTVDEQRRLLDAEGTWDPEVARKTLARAEDVSVLRWVLGVDRILAPFEHAQLTVVPAVQLMLRPALVETGVCLEPSDLRPAQAATEAMLVRLLGEGIERGIYSGDDPESAREILFHSGRIADDESLDLLIGETVVARATNEAIQNMGVLAARRGHVIWRVIQYLYGPAWLFRIEPGLAEADVYRPEVNVNHEM